MPIFSSDNKKYLALQIGIDPMRKLPIYTVYEMTQNEDGTASLRPVGDVQFEISDGNVYASETIIASWVPNDIALDGHEELVTRIVNNVLPEAMDVINRAGIDNSILPVSTLGGNASAVLVPIPRAYASGEVEAMRFILTHNFYPLSGETSGRIVTDIKSFATEVAPIEVSPNKAETTMSGTASAMLIKVV